jgi:hypothetical protein
MITKDFVRKISPDLEGSRMGLEVHHFNSIFQETTSYSLVLHNELDAPISGEGKKKASVLLAL